jgi:hypothetical protein
MIVQGYLNNVPVGPAATGLLKFNIKTTLELSTIGVVDELRFTMVSQTAYDDFRFQWTDAGAPACIAV